MVVNICTFNNHLLIDATDDLDDLNFFNQKKKKKKPKKIFDIDEAEEGVKVCFCNQAILSIARNLLAFIFWGLSGLSVEELFPVRHLVLMLLIEVSLCPLCIVVLLNMIVHKDILSGNEKV